MILLRGGRDKGKEVAGMANECWLKYMRSRIRHTPVCLTSDGYSTMLYVDLDYSVPVEYRTQGKYKYLWPDEE